MNELYLELFFWKVNYVVIVNFNDDLLIVDISVVNLFVYVVFEGGEFWCIVDLLFDLFIVFVILIEVVCVYGGEVKDEEIFEIKFEYLEYIEFLLIDLFGVEYIVYLIEYLLFC